MAKKTKQSKWKKEYMELIGALGREGKPTNKESHNLRFWNLYRMYISEISLIAFNVIKWKKLPLSVDPFVIERTLMEKGAIYFFNDNREYFATQDIWLCLPGVETALGVDGKPTVFDIHGLNGYFTRRDFTNCVPIYNNALKAPYMDKVYEYAYRFANLQIAIEQNLKLQKFPYLLFVTKENENAIKIMFDDITNGATHIFTRKDRNKDFDIETDVQNLELKAPYIVDKLRQEIVNETRNMLTVFGIDSANTEKRERLNTDEVNANNGHINMQREILLSTRQYAVDRINDYWDLGIEVEYRKLNYQDFENGIVIEDEDGGLV